MAKYAIIKETDPAAAVRSLLQKLLSEKLVDAVLTTAPTPYSPLPMPTLFTDPEKMEAVDPLAPAAPFNAARQAAIVARHPDRYRLALVLRPCELRAMIELVKLNQCELDNMTLIGIECYGRMENRDFLEQAARTDSITRAFLDGSDLKEKITRTCQTCDRFQPQGADLNICVFGNHEGGIGIAAESENGSNLFSDMGLKPTDPPADREERIRKILEKRQGAKARLISQTRERLQPIEQFEKVIANCLNCHNCRIACPVCYCRECVFLTDVFAHKPEILLQRAERRGLVKMPTETTMFHLTRMAHMSHACVECGHCSSVCPSDIPVADVFRTVAGETQALFGYEPGRDVNEPIPFLSYRDEGDENA
jgi:formate dehydrogenase subunit beta